MGIGLRTPTDSGLEEYAEILSSKDIPFTTVKELNGNKYFSLEDNNGHISQYIQTRIIMVLV